MSDYTIRTATPDDAEAIIAFMKVLSAEPNNHVSFSSADEFTYTVEQERDILQKHADDPTMVWLVAFDQDNRLISHSNLSHGPRGFVHTISLGISVAKDWRDRGVGTAVMRAAMAWCEANPLIKRLELEVFAGNARAIHVYEKLGFVREGVRRAAFRKEGQFHDLIMMAVVYDRPNLEG